jgi:gliding motility-associated-like protein
MTCGANTTLQPIANDSAASNMLLTNVLSSGYKGVIALGGNNLSYIADSCFEGIDTLFYTVCLANNIAICDTGMILISILNCPCKKPMANFTASDTVACQYGNAIQFFDKSTNNPISWKWYFTGANIDSSTLQNPFVFYKAEGVFSASLQTTNIYGISNLFTKTNYINVWKGILPNRNDTIYASPNSTIYLDVYQPNYIAYLWMPKVGLSNPNIFNPTFQYNGGIDFLQYSVSYNALCYTEHKIVILPKRIMENGFVYIPNCITPNHDGINDVWQLKHKNILICDIKIFNKWGNCVFESNDINSVWNGSTFGKDFETTTYQYVIKATYTNGVKEVKKGDVIVIQ